MKAKVYIKFKVTKERIKKSAIYQTPHEPRGEPFPCNPRRKIIEWKILWSKIKKLLLHEMSKKDEMRNGEDFLKKASFSTRITNRGTPR
jgi:hypothetical protein